MARRVCYYISGLEIAQRQDEAGIRASIGLLGELIAREIARGVEAKDILVAGFSQGGAIVLSGGLRYPQRLGGIVALSTYLPLAEKTDAEAAPANRDVPVFMAHGMLDPTISHALGEMSRDYLAHRGYAIDWHAYPMAHQVCARNLRPQAPGWLGARLELGTSLRTKRAHGH
jgi:phospholipase/carboxylesterase